MVTIKRTQLADTPKAATWVGDEYGRAYGHADHVFEQDYPTHSPVLGPDGAQLRYEPRQPIGFDLKGEHK